MKQIIAMGGGGFSMEPEKPLLDHYILSQSQKDSPQVCFLPTASGDSEGYIANFYKAFEQHKCKPSHLSLFKLPTKDLEAYVLEKDIIYVGGGNTKSMLALWREWGVDVILRKAWEQGTILAGISAGSICWFREGLTDSYGEDELRSLPCLGFLPGSFSPHYDGEVLRRPTFQKYVAEETMLSGYAADDGVAFHYVGEQLHLVVSSRKQAKGYSVSHVESGVFEQEMPTDYLGGGA